VLGSAPAPLGVAGRAYKAAVLHGILLAGCIATRPERPEIGAKQPLAERWFFPLDSGPDFGGKSVCDNTTFPGFDRHHGPPLAGFAVCGLRDLRNDGKGGRGNRAA